MAKRTGCILFIYFKGREGKKPADKTIKKVREFGTVIKFNTSLTNKVMLFKNLVCIASQDQMTKARSLKGISGDAKLTSVGAKRRKMKHVGYQITTQKSAR